MTEVGFRQRSTAAGKRGDTVIAAAARPRSHQAANSHPAGGREGALYQAVAYQHTYQEMAPELVGLSGDSPLRRFMHGSHHVPALTSH